MKKCVILILVLVFMLSGCSGLGLEKSTTLLPDTIGISFMQENYRGDSAAWRGFGILLEWELK